MKSNPLVAGVLLAGLALSGPVAAQTQVLYVTDGDSARLARVQGGVLLGTTATHVRGYPLTVTGTSIWIGDYNGGQPDVHEYTLAGVATGATVPNVVRNSTDGASDGTRAWQMEAFAGLADVFVSPSVDFQGSALAFSVAGTDLVGITFDTVSQTLWISDEDNIYNYTTAGVLISQFAHAGVRGSLAYEGATDTLWHVQNSSDNIRQYSKAGVLLQTLVVAGLNSNNWGAEFLVTAAPAPGIPTPIPTLSQWGIGLLALLMAMFGIGQARRARLEGRRA
jgi:hypothetical protein